MTGKKPPKRERNYQEEYKESVEQANRLLAAIDGRDYREGPGDQPMSEDKTKKVIEKLRARGVPIEDPPRARQVKAKVHHPRDRGGRAEWLQEDFRLNARLEETPKLGKRVFILDTTLRDGLLDRIKTLSESDKAAIAVLLHRLGVDIIETACDSRTIRRLTRAISRIDDDSPSELPVVCATVDASEGSLCKMRELIRTIWEEGFGGDAKPGLTEGYPKTKRRIHLYLPISIHMREIRGLEDMDNDSLTSRITDCVRIAREIGFTNIQVSAQDAIRTDPVFLIQLFGAIIDAAETDADEQATLTLNLADTIGLSTPKHVGWLVEKVAAALPLRADRVMLGAHFHNDLGMCTSNALAALEHGARQIDVSAAGVGPRTGNVPLEQLAALLEIHGYMNLRCGIRIDRLAPALQKIIAVLGIIPPHDKPIIGSNAHARLDTFAVDPEEFACSPQLIGTKSKAIVSLRGLDEFLISHDYGQLASNGPDKLKIEALRTDIDKLRKVAGRIYEDDVLALASQIAPNKDADLWILEELNLSIHSRSDKDLSTATVSLRSNIDGRKIVEVATAGGPMTAILNALQRALRIEVRVLGYKTGLLPDESGKSGTSRSVINLAVAGDKRIDPVLGQFTSENILVSGAKACLQAMNLLLKQKMTIARSELAALNPIVKPRDRSSGDAPEVLSISTWDASSGL